MELASPTAKSIRNSSSAFPRTPVLRWPTKTYTVRASNRKRQYQAHPAASFLRHDSSSTMHSGAHDIKEMQIRNRWPLYSFIICMGESKRHCCHTGEWTLFG